MVNNGSNSRLSKEVKQVGLLLRLYEFKQRLKYKCATKGINYKCTNESYTSKMCSMCGNIKEDLGSSKVYECIKCGNKMDRDINGSRMIYIKSIN